jgi:6-phosphogluconolactonase (cycloisomerase 2 family)
MPVRTARTAGLGIAAAATAAALFAAPLATAATTPTTPNDTAGFATATTARPAHPRGGAVLVQSDNLTANTVVAYHRSPDGTLTRRGTYPTGGRGGVLAGSVVDHLASQGSLAYDRQAGLLYAVNAGSDSLTVFTVHGDRLERVQTIPTAGDFPVSVTFHDRRVWVLNALGGGSVQGFVRVGQRLRGVDSWRRDLGLDPDATPQFTNTPGQIGFTPDGSELIVTTKAVGNSIDVFPLGPLGAPSAKPVVTPTPGAVPFGFAFDPAGRLQVTEAGPNAVATFTVGRHGTLTAVGQVATGQAATCWITATGQHLYASNAGSGSLSGYTAAGHGALTPLGDTMTDGGTVDAAATGDGHYLYVQTGAMGVVDEFRVGHDGSLTRIGAVTVPGGVGGEGIAAG